MQLNLDPGFDADLELAHLALDRGWVSREAIESAILEQERTPGSRLLNLLPLTPEQRRRLESPDAKSVPDEIVEAARDPARRVDQYILGEHLQSGGMGRICKAWDVKLSRWVALKFLKAVGDERSEAYFEREARLAAQLSHPNIATIYGSGQSGGDRYIAMQFIPGRTLDAWRRGDPLRLAALVRDAARAVAYANGRGIIHRDLKPMNVMVTPEGRVCVLDFGLARPVDSDARHSATGKAMGTPAYMSPEQARGAAVSARSDVYGLGATLYECLTGKPPFTGKTIYDVLRRVEEDAPVKPRKLNPHVPADLETIVLKCLEKDPARRYGTADGLADDLERFLNHDAISARPSGIVYRTAKLMAKRKAIAFASAASLVLAAVLGWWFLVGSPRAEQLRVEGEHLRLREEAMKLWAEARGLAMAGVDPAGIRRRASVAREAFDRALQKQEDASILVMKARCLQLEGGKNEALKTLERAHTLDTNHAEARLELAKALLLRYQISRGVPNVQWVRYDLGSADRLLFGELPKETAEQGGWRKRGESLLVGAKVSGSAHEALLVGLLEMGTGRHSQAAEALTVYTKAEPWDAQVLLLLGICRYFSRDLQGAVTGFDLAANRTQQPLVFRWRGMSKLAQGDIAGALEDYTSSIALDSKDADSFSERGTAKNSLHRFEDAIADFTKAIELNPKLDKAYNNRGLAHRDLGRLDEAIADFTRAIELDPGYATAYSNRGIAKLGKLLHDEAIMDFSKAVELKPDFSAAFSNRGVAKYGKGLFDEAIVDANRAVELDPKNAEAYYNRANPKYVKGLHEEAISDYSKAIDLNPAFAGAYVCRGLAKKALGRRKEAIADFTKGLELNPKDERTYMDRGVAKGESGDYDGAIADFTKVIELNPAKSLAYRNRGFTYRTKGLTREAIADYSKAIELDSKDAAALYSRGNALESIGKLDEAIQDWTRAIEADPKHALAHLNRGSAKAEKGLLEESFTDLTRALELKPDEALAYLNRGMVQEKLGRLERALSDYEKAIQISPSNWPQRKEAQQRRSGLELTLQYKQAERLYNSKQYLAAIEGFRKIVEEHPESRKAISSAYNIACGYALLGDKPKALEWLQKAVDLGFDDAEHLEKDGDLISIRGEEGYKRLMSRLKGQ